MKVTDYFPQFTELARKFRPYIGDALVYEVDAGEPTDYNVVMKAACFDEDMNMLDKEPHIFIISKEWLLEYYKDALV